MSWWLIENAQLLNHIKTEVVTLGTNKQLPQVNSSQDVHITRVRVEFADAVELL